MGNRAVLNFEGSDTGIYLHWNGGRASIEAFLAAANDLELRTDDYGIARLAQAIGNWFGGTLSIGVGSLSRLDRDNGDNGEYVIKGWKIIGRNYFEGSEEVDAEKTSTIRKEVVSATLRVDALKTLLDEFPGLINGESDVCGSDLVNRATELFHEPQSTGV